MTKMTAVEWLEIQFQEGHSYINEIFEREFKQAKEMEKQQIIDAATWGALQETGEQYYSEIFKKENQ
jgi:hypothetical protein